MSDLETSKSVASLLTQTNVKNMLWRKYFSLCVCAPVAISFTQWRKSFTWFPGNLLTLPIERYMSFSLVQEFEGGPGSWRKHPDLYCTQDNVYLLPDQLLDRAWEKVSFCYHFAVAMERVGILLADVWFTILMCLIKITLKYVANFNKLNDTLTIIFVCYLTRKQGS